MPELTGLSDLDPIRNALRKFQADPYDPQTLTLSLSLTLQRAAIRGLGDESGAVVMLDPRTGEVLVLASTPFYDASAIANPATETEGWAAVADNPALPLLTRPTQGRYVPGSIFKVVTAIAGLGSGAIEPTTTFPNQAAAEKDGLVVSGFRINEHPGVAGADVQPRECDGGLVEHLVRARRARDRRREPRGVRRAARVRGAAAVRPADGRLPGDRRQGFGAGRLQGRRRARQRRLRPGQDLRHAAPDGARGGDGGQQRRADAAAPRHRADRQGGDPSDRARNRSDGSSRQADADAITAAMLEAVEGDLGRQFTRGAKVPGIPTAGKSGTAELGGSGEPHSWFIGFAPANDPQIAIAVLVERGGRGGARAAPLAGSLMKAYFDTVAPK